MPEIIEYEFWAEMGPEITKAHARVKDRPTVLVDPGPTNSFVELTVSPEDIARQSKRLRLIGVLPAFIEKVKNGLRVTWGMPPHARLV